MVDNLLELGAIDGELVLEVLDLLQEVLGNIGHGTWRSTREAIGSAIGIPRNGGGKWEEESYEFTLAGGGTLRTDSNHDDGE